MDKNGCFRCMRGAGVMQEISTGNCRDAPWCVRQCTERDDSDAPRCVPAKLVNAILQNASCVAENVTLWYFTDLCNGTQNSDCNTIKQPLFRDLPLLVLQFDAFCNAISTWLHYSQVLIAPLFTVVFRAKCRLLWRENRCVGKWVFLNFPMTNGLRI